MKRISSLILVAAFVLGGAVSAMAASNVDVKVKGQWDFVFGWNQNKGFADNDRHQKKYGKRQDDNGIAAQRIRTQVNFIMSENLQAVLQFEIGDMHWGNDGGNYSKVGRGSGGSLGGDGVNVETKHAYLDWMIPSSDLHIRMGLQGLALPSAAGFGSPLFDDDVAGIVASYKINDTFGVTAFWARPYNRYLNDSDNGKDGGNWSKHPSIADEVDMFGLIVPITLDGFNITPWGVWANVGSASGLYNGLLGTRHDELSYEENDKASAWWTGVAFSADLWDPLTFGIDAMYGSLGKNSIGTKAADNPTPSEISASGWFVLATLDYKLDWGTPGLFGWWSSGDTAKGINAGHFGRIPVVPTSSGLNRTSFSWDGAFGIADAVALSSKGVGTWGVGIQVAEMSFIEDLSHTIRLVYHQGTNDADIIKNGDYGGVRWGGVETVYMTDKDRAYEINFDHKYQIYENLAAVLELGWIHLDLDKNTWKNAGGGTKSDWHKTDDAWKAQLSFQYKF